MNFKRADRVGELILAEMSDILLRSVKDPRLNAVTITAVKVTDDLRNAKIYFVEMGKDELNEEILAGLTRARGFVRRELGHRLQLRFVPEILFVHDKSFGYGNRIERLLDQIARQEEKHD
ncbi:MAG: 30S ribosome-binding factor RbfA [Smithellaceae bacterium]|jgi:ribosome-binding factor A|nr:30S ribosome-binding factor RbfA [Smithellaceae bacterium]MDD3259754.1 30S ribosome-binding factor RbfA [Smithellaceae bacterium]MDD3849312.1 30S ribosome-binding factor RbfA [Smithellaceae bacterium]HOG12364.1 30S ribosome-binding factor RbfA [Smithellaceae bacterium]HOQ72586.1 30S ribosome-binding factor RbfA [Smithellaceae bacterium]